jgi:pantoate--beta-alanine ligase
MGALHDGHATLIRQAVRLRAERYAGALVVVSVFVNPTQFNDRSDLSRYPRTLSADVNRCAEAGADVVFAPDEQVIYPSDAAVPVPEIPAVATQPGLEDAFRPGHFAGVCQVVARLFALMRPAAALFGEKDWQQYQVIKAMAARMKGPHIVGVPTVREPDGLAMSSRNVFLSAVDRAAAVSVPRALRAAGACKTVGEAERAMLQILTEGGMRSEYAVVRAAESLLPVPEATARSQPMRALIAARIGSVRLIDNAAWPG